MLLHKIGYQVENPMSTQLGFHPELSHNRLPMDGGLIWFHSGPKKSGPVLLSPCRKLYRQKLQAYHNMHTSCCSTKMNQIYLFLFIYFIWRGIYLSIHLSSCFIGDFLINLFLYLFQFFNIALLAIIWNKIEHQIGKSL